MALKFQLIALLLVVYTTSSMGQSASYQNRCEVGVTSTNDMLDTCDKERFLTCKDGRCLCQDQANQIWSSIEILTRTKRAKGSKGKKGGGSNKGGGGGRVAAGVAAGAAGGYLASSVVNSGSRPSLSSILPARPVITTTKTRRYHSCYSRVGGECVLDNSGVNGDIIVNLKTVPTTEATSTSTESTATTTTVSTTAGVVAGESTTGSTTPNPKNETDPVVTSSTTESSVTSVTPSPVVDLKRIPKCVEFAICTIPPVTIVNGTVVSGGERRDPRLGVCSCRDGYKANSQDVCVKM